MKIDQPITTVADYEATIKEFPVTGALRLENGDTLLMNESPYRLEEDGFRRFCEQLSAPPGYMKDLPAGVRQPVLQHHLECSALDRLTLIVREGRFLAFGRPDLFRISGREALGAVQEGAGCELEVHSFHIQDESFQADLLVEGANEEVAVGDVVRAGLRISHSMIGDHATRVEAFIYRLVCSNGMTHRECAGSRAARTRRLPVGHHDARKRQIEQVRKLTAEVAGTLRRKLEAIRGLRQEKVDVQPLMRRFLERGGMSPRLWLPALQEAWAVEGSEATTYGVMNAFTRVATHGVPHMPEVVVSPRHRRILSGLAGVLAFREHHFCPRCFSQLRGQAPGTAVELN